MSSVWNGSALRTRYSQKYGFSDTTSLARVLEWLNEGQEDICDSRNWPFLKIKIKKQIISGNHEIDISPQIPSAASAAVASGGTLTADQAYYIKTTFLLFAESGKEEDSIESEPSDSVSATPTGANLSINLTAIDLYDDANSELPTTIHRRIYLSTDNVSFYLYSTLTNNTATTASITAATSSTIEPPEESLVHVLASESPQIEASGIKLCEESLNNITDQDPGFTSTGVPRYYARVGQTKILLYPKPTSTYTLTYWVFKKPSRIFAETTRKLQIPSYLKNAMDAYVTWKGHEHKDQDGQESKYDNFEALADKEWAKHGRTNTKSGKVREVC